MANQVFVSVEDSLPSPPWLENVESFANSVMTSCSIDNQELSILFCSDDFIRTLNRRFRQIDSATDILSFSNGEKYTDETGRSWLQAGDIAISVDTLKRNAEYFGVSQNEELKRLLIHGILHLCGYDHGNENCERGVKPKSEMLLRQEDLMHTFDSVTLIHKLG